VIAGQAAGLRIVGQPPATHGAEIAHRLRARRQGVIQVALADGRGLLGIEEGRRQTAAQAVLPVVPALDPPAPNPGERSLS
jgi:hypothetical protein